MSTEQIDDCLQLAARIDCGVVGMEVCLLALKVMPSASLITTLVVITQLPPGKVRRPRRRRWCCWRQGRRRHAAWVTRSCKTMPSTPIKIRPRKCVTCSGIRHIVAWRVASSTAGAPALSLGVAPCPIGAMCRVLTEVDQRIAAIVKAIAVHNIIAHVSIF